VGSVPAFATLPRFDPVQGTGDVCDPAARCVEQVVGRPLSPTLLVDPGCHRLAGQHPLGQYDGDGQLECGDCVDRIGMRHRDDQRLDGLVQQPVHRTVQGVVCELGQTDQRDAVSSGMTSLLNGGCHHARAVEGQVGSDHADVSAVRECASGVLAAVAELLDRRQDAHPGRCLDGRLLVEDPGDRLVRHSGARGDVRHGGWSGVLGSCELQRHEPW
jgi:hypothetical protein